MFRYNLTTRRWLFSVGVALIVGGWTMTWYAREQQKAYKSHAISAWVGESRTKVVPSKGLFQISVASMAIGSGFVAFAVFPARKARQQPEEKDDAA